MLCFHGIGQDHTCFHKIYQVLENQCTFYGIDLFYHGNSPAIGGGKPTPDDRLSKAHWKELLEELLKREQIEQFSVMGFSMGGKFAFATLEAFPDRIEELLLLAPDGPTESPWYRLATRFVLTRRIFRWYILNTQRFKQLAHFLERLSLVNKSTIRFAQSTLATPQQQLRVYHAWLGFSPLKFDMKEVSQLLNQHQVSVKIFLGSFDALLPAHYMNPLLKQLHRFELVMLKTGHNKLVDKTAEWFSAKPSQRP